MYIRTFILSSIPTDSNNFPWIFILMSRQAVLIGNVSFSGEPVLNMGIQRNFCWSQCLRETAMAPHFWLLFLNMKRWKQALFYKNLQPQNRNQCVVFHLRNILCHHKLLK